MRRALVVIGVVVVAWWSTSQQTATFLTRLFRKPVCPDCNVLLISIDALSANHLPCYGYRRNTAPNLCALAGNGVLFQNAFSNSTWTLPGHVSIFTGLYPSYHRVEDFESSLSPKLPFLPVILQRHGYETYFTLPDKDPTLPIGKVYSRGITALNTEAYHATSSADVSADLNRGLREFRSRVLAGKKTFTFLHTYYVHSPYTIEDRKKIYTTDHISAIPIHAAEIYQRPFSWDFLGYLRKALGAEYDGLLPQEIYRNFSRSLAAASTLAEAEKAFVTGTQEFKGFYINYYYYQAKIDKHNPRQVQYLRDLYDQRIHELDEWVGNVLAPFLNDPVLANNTLVMITSDHGEEFMEHGAIMHETIYDSNLKIPLILMGKNVPQRVVNDNVQSVDIVPTLLDLLGIPATPYRFQGVSLADTVRAGKPLPRRLLIADGHVKQNVTTVRDDKWKLFINDPRRQNIPLELYDMQSDPGETQNLLSKYEEVTKRLIRESNQFTRKWNEIIAKMQ